MDSIPEMRKRVADLDAKLVRLLAARLELTDMIGAEKKVMKMPVYDPETERAVVERAGVLAAELGISPAMIETVMRTAMAGARLRQDSTGHNPLEPAPDRDNIAFSRYMPPPMEFKSAIPLSEKAGETVDDARNEMRDILDGGGERRLLVMGPCSIHDPKSAEEYAVRLRDLKRKVDDVFLLVMRTYVEKSRTGAGWTGFLTDPRLDGSGDVQEGITMTRKLLNRIGEMGIPVAVEFINPLSAAYIGDLVSWAAIGARSSGSQIHRDMASGLPMSMGFKNGVDGGVDSAIGAIASAGQSHDFLGLDDAGNIAAFKTRGNRHCHLVLRGGERPNYDEMSVAAAAKAMETAGLRPNIMVDCSHGNSGKVAIKQIEAFESVIEQIAAGNQHIIGLMLESHINPGRQEPGPALKYGVSVTDECLGWEETEAFVINAYERLAE